LKLLLVEPWRRLCVITIYPITIIKNASDKREIPKLSEPCKDVPGEPWHPRTGCRMHLTFFSKLMMGGLHAKSIQRSLSTLMPQSLPLVPVEGFSPTK
jgi:hypothetical protein